MKKTEIIPVEYANSVLSESMIFENGAENKFRPIVFMIYLIKTENRNILADAGCVTMPGFDMKSFIGPVKALEELGVSPDDITDLIITHAHHDHIECAGCFKNATVYIQRDEYEAGKDYLRENTDIRLFDEQIWVCDGVRAIKIGGHTKGSCIVEVASPNGISIIAGDECYSRECLVRKIPTGSTVNRDRSRDFVEKYGNGSYKVYLCHEK